MKVAYVNKPPNIYLRATSQAKYVQTEIFLTGAAGFDWRGVGEKSRSLHGRKRPMRFGNSFPESERCACSIGIKRHRSYDRARSGSFSANLLLQSLTRRMGKADASSHLTLTAPRNNSVSPIHAQCRIHAGLNARVDNSDVQPYDAY